MMDVNSIPVSTSWDAFEKQSSENTNTVSKEVEEKSSLWLSKRLLVCIVLFLSFMNIQILRNNMNIIVVEMTAVKVHVEGNTTIRKRDFDWNTTTIGLVLSIFSYGGLFGLFGGFMADRLGGAATCVICMMASGILTVAQPVSLYVNFYSFLVFRFLTGLFEMFFYVGTVEVNSRWFPKKEKSMLLSFIFNGTNAGLAIVYPLCGYLANKWRWDVALYVTGAMAIVTAVLFWICVKNSPEQDKWISKKELSYILAETDQIIKQKIDHPYKSILTSLPVWSLYIVTFAYMCMASVIGTCLPLYVKDLTHKGTDEIGLLSSIPYTVYFFLIPLSGILMDYWKNHTDISFTRMHKILISIGFLSASVFFIVAAYVSDFLLTLVFFVLIQIISSPAVIIMGFLTTYLSLDHCNVVVSLVSFFLAVGAIVPQITIGVLTEHHSSKEWNNCFVLAAVVTACGAIFFVVFGSSDTQQWPKNGD